MCSNVCMGERGVGMRVEFRCCRPYDRMTLSLIVFLDTRVSSKMTKKGAKKKSLYKYTIVILKKTHGSVYLRTKTKRLEVKHELTSVSWVQNP